MKNNGQRSGVAETVFNSDGSKLDNNLAYSYDAANRLLEETRHTTSTAAVTGTTTSSGSDCLYSYDGVGNRLQKVVKDGTGTAVQTVAHTYNANDWLLTQSTTNGNNNTSVLGYGYDDAGDQTSVISDPDGAHQVTPYLYDFEHHLVQVGLSSSPHTSYAYDAQGTRLTKVTTDSNGPHTSRYLTDQSMGSGQVLSEFDEQGNQKARYDWADDEPVRLDWNKTTSSPAGPVTTSGSSFYLTDGLNSVRQLTDTNGNVTDAYSYDAWGNWAAGSGSTPNAYYFNAQQGDAGGYYLRARYYNPASGRFLSHDPLLGRDNDPFTLHRYLYVGNDPVNVVDPSGEDGDLGSLGAGTAGAGTLAAQANPAIVQAEENAAGTIGSTFANAYSGLFSNVWPRAVTVAQNSLGRFLQLEEKASAKYPEESNAYSEQITGVLRGWVWRFQGSLTKFDGFSNGKLLEAKARYEQFLLDNGQWKPWFQGGSGMVKQARDQIAANAGRFEIEWHFEEERVAIKMEQMFADAGVTGIKVIHTPPQPSPY